MSIELRPLGDRCNIRCRYCYQEGMRTSNATTPAYSLPAIFKALDEMAEPFTVFGGEALLLRPEHLEELFAYGLRRFGVNSIQTNGTLIDRSHIALFRKYKVQVGLSLDGPEMLNDARWAGSERRTRRGTARAEAALDRLCREGLAPRLIVTLHRVNTSGTRLDVLCGWLRSVIRAGVREVRVHLLEVDSDNSSAGLRMNDDENIRALRRLRDLVHEVACLRIDLFDEMRRMLIADDESSSCVWQACDPYATRGVRGVEGFGQPSNCGRTHKGGIAYIPAVRRGYERQISLYETAKEHGGCRDCRFFLMCKGNCPGTALQGDWRLRSEHCATWYALFEDIEAELLASGVSPISRSPRRELLEHNLVELWRDGGDESLRSLIRRVGYP